MVFYFGYFLIGCIVVYGIHKAGFFEDMQTMATQLKLPMKDNDFLWSMVIVGLFLWPIFLLLVAADEVQKLIKG